MPRTNELCRSAVGEQACFMDPRTQILQITRAIWLGPFASPQRLSALTSAGITHVLNVGEAPSVLAADVELLQEVAWHPIADLERVPDSVAIECLETLHRMVCKSDARLYVHCIAGWNRSPTIVWLYLVACGIPPAEARRIIEIAAPDAIPAHPRLVDNQLTEFVQAFGAQRFLPHPRPQVIECLDVH